MLETGVPVAIERRGKTLLLSPRTPASKLARLRRRKLVKGAAESLVKARPGTWRERRIVKGPEPILSALGRDIGLQIEAAEFPRVAAAARSLGWTRDRAQVWRDAMDAGQRFRGAGQRALYAEAVNWYDAAFLMGHRGKI